MGSDKSGGGVECGYGISFLGQVMRGMERSSVRA